MARRRDESVRLVSHEGGVVSTPYIWVIEFKRLAEPAETKEEMTIEN